MANQEIVTTDLSKFGNREKSMAADLLKAYSNNPPDFLGDGVTVMFNSHSGYVFLTDEDYNVGVMDNADKEIVQFFSCGECGNEGTTEDGYVAVRDGCNECKKS